MAVSTSTVAASLLQFPGSDILFRCVFNTWNLAEFEDENSIIGMLWKSDPRGRKWELRCFVLNKQVSTFSYYESYEAFK